MDTKNKHLTFAIEWFSSQVYDDSREWVKDKISWILWVQTEKIFWSVSDLEPFWYLTSQENWNNFKKTQLYWKYKVPDIVKGVLISRKIIP